MNIIGKLLGFFIKALIIMVVWNMAAMAFGLPTIGFWLTCGILYVVSLVSNGGN